MSTAPLPASDVESLQLEVEALKAQVSSERAARARRRRSAFSWFLAVLAILATTMALTTTWTYRTLNNTDLFVERVAPIIEEPAVVAEVSSQVSTAIVDQLQLEDRIAEQLPPEAAALAAPISAAARNYLEKATTALIGTDQFQAAWETALAVSHDLAISLLEGDTTGGVTNENGEITVNLVPIINTVLESASEFLGELLGRDINLPTVTADQVDQAITAIEDQFGVDLPADFGQVTLFSSDSLATAQDAYQAATVAAWLMPIAALALIGLAVAVSLRRLRMFLSIVVGSALSLGFVALALQPVKNSVLNSLSDEGLRSAVGAAVQTGLSSLRTGVVIMLVIGLIAALVLFFSGRSELAASSREAAGRVPGLAARYRGAFIVGGVVLALILLALLPGRSWGQFLTVMLVLATYIVAVLFAPKVAGPEVDEDDAAALTGTSA